MNRIILRCCIKSGKQLTRIIAERENDKVFWEETAMDAVKYILRNNTPELRKHWAEVCDKDE